MLETQKRPLNDGVTNIVITKGNAEKFEDRNSADSVMEGRDRGGG